MIIPVVTKDIMYFSRLKSKINVNKYNLVQVKNRKEIENILSNENCSLLIVDFSDDLAKSIAIFDVTKQISNTLGQLVKDNSFSSNTTTKYYGVYLILSEILGYAQREYITKIDEEYLTKLESYKESGYQSIQYANEQMRQATMQSSKSIFKKNIEAEEFTIKVIDAYKGILLDQKAQLDNALITTDEQIAVAYSTYKTASNSSVLMSLMIDTQSTFDQILKMQMPDIIPFENIELENEFKSLSNKLSID